MYRIVIAILAVLLGSSGTWAAPHQITSGEFAWGPGGDGLAGTVRGQDFSYFACCNDVGTIPARSAGAFVTSGAVLTYGGPSTFAGSNTFVFQGTTHVGNANLLFSSPEFVLTRPQPPTSVSEFFDVQQPFTVAGTMRAVQPSNPSVTLFSMDVTGQGTATGTFRHGNTTNDIVFHSLSYVFAPFAQLPFPGNGGAGVIPEPTTALLVASGLVGLRLMRRAMRKGPHS
jgi:hypothetical protein